MPKAIRYTLLSIRDLLVSFGPFVVLAIVLLGLAYWWLDPNPPREVTLATGPAQSAYDNFGKQYAKVLEGYGIKVTLRQSEGSSDNLKLLRDGEVDLAFVQGGTMDAKADEDDELESLGSLFVEPVWLFYREDSVKKTVGTTTVGSLTQLKGLRVNVGTPGSGVPTLMGKLLESNRLSPQDMTLSELSQTPATVALINGEVDAIVFASAPESQMVQMLLMTPGIKVMDFVQNEAYSRRFAFLSAVVLPRGVVDLANDMPNHNVRLVAPTTSLITHKDTHPALVQLFSAAARQLHSGAGWFNKAHEFPNVRQDELPLAKEADRYIRNGAPFLERYLSFWLANLVERMWLSMGLILAMLVPLSRILPPLYQFRVRSRVFKWYARLREIEDEVENQPVDPAKLLRDLDELDARVGRIHVPLSYADQLYALRNHITMVRRKLLPAATEPS